MITITVFALVLLILAAAGAAIAIEERWHQSEEQELQGKLELTREAYLALLTEQKKHS